MNRNLQSSESIVVMAFRKNNDDSCNIYIATFFTQLRSSNDSQHSQIWQPDSLKKSISCSKIMTFGSKIYFFPLNEVYQIGSTFPIKDLPNSYMVLHLPPSLQRWLRVNWFGKRFNINFFLRCKIVTRLSKDVEI